MNHWSYRVPDYYAISLAVLRFGRFATIDDVKALLADQGFPARDHHAWVLGWHRHVLSGADRKHNASVMSESEHREIRESADRIVADLREGGAR